MEIGDILRREWYSSDAPPIHYLKDDKPILLVSWWCTIYSLVVILTRVLGRYARTEKFYTEDGIMVFAILPLFIRMGLIHAVLVYGTNNTLIDGLTDPEIRRREIGSQLVLGARICYVAYLWTIKFSSSTFLHHLTTSATKNSALHTIVLRGLHITLLLTFIGQVISILGTCQPFDHLWQVVPDPGVQCRGGYPFLITMAVTDAVTNLLLVILPIPVILMSKLGKGRKFIICTRLALPLLSVIFIGYEMPHIFQPSNGTGNTQAHRTLLASLAILLCTFTSNAVVLMSLLRDRGFKKSKWKWEMISPSEDTAPDARRIKVRWETQWKERENEKNDGYTGGVNFGFVGQRRGLGGSVNIVSSARIDGRSLRGSMESVRRKENSLGESGKGKGPVEIEMKGIEMPEQARLLGEIRVAREWEVSSSM